MDGAVIGAIGGAGGVAVTMVVCTATLFFKLGRYTKIIEQASDRLPPLEKGFSDLKTAVSSITTAVDNTNQRLDRIERLMNSHNPGGEQR